MRTMLKARVDSAGGITAVAKKLGVSKDTMYSWCSGHSDFRGAAVDSALALAEILGCSVEELVHDASVEVIEDPKTMTLYTRPVPEFQKPRRRMLRQMTA